MEASCPPTLVLVPSGAPAEPASRRTVRLPEAAPRQTVRLPEPAPRQTVRLPEPASRRTVRLPETVYRRRRLAVATILVAVLTLVLALGRPDRVPPGEANPWPSTGDPSLPVDLPGVYVVQPGDTLWDIALAVAPGDPRALVHDLSEAAGGAALKPGQEIVIGASALAHGPDGAVLLAGQRAAAERAGPEAERTDGDS